jgi:hypothetical protein
MRDFTIFSKMSKLRVLEARGTFFDSLKQANIFLGEILKNFKALEQLILDYYMLDLFYKISKHIPNVCPTMKYINGYDIRFDQPNEAEAEVNQVCEFIWKIAQPYSLEMNSGETEGTNASSNQLFYVMDEVGTALIHSSDAPNSVCAPFVYMPTQKLNNEAISYSLLWVNQDIPQGATLSVTKYEEGIHSAIFDTLEEENVKTLLGETLLRKKELQEKAKTKEKEIEILIGSTKGGAAGEGASLPLPILKVASNDSEVHSHLKSDNFQIESKMSEADIIWLLPGSQKILVSNQIS